MLELQIIPKAIYDDKRAREVVTKHINKKILGKLLPEYAKNFTCPLNKSELSKEEINNFYNKVYFIGDTKDDVKDRINTILDKIKDKESKTLDVKETFILYTLIPNIIELTEKEIMENYNKRGTEGIKAILELYKIKNKKEREYLQKLIIKKSGNFNKNKIRKALNYKNNKFQTSVANAVDVYETFLFEFPSIALNLFISEQEYDLLMILEEQKSKSTFKNEERKMRNYV